MNIQSAQTPPRHNQPVVVFLSSGVVKVGVAVHDRGGNCKWYVHSNNINISFIQGQPTDYASVPLHHDKAVANDVTYWCELSELMPMEMTV